MLVDVLDHFVVDVSSKDSQKLRTVASLNNHVGEHGQFRQSDERQLGNLANPPEAKTWGGCSYGSAGGSQDA
eukprot:6481794-Amphidinium_carterae.1